MWRQRLQQKGVAQQLGIGQPALSRKLRGDRPWTVGELYALTIVLQQPLMAILGIEAPVYPDDPSSLPDLVSEWSRVRTSQEAPHRVITLPSREAA